MASRKNSTSIWGTKPITAPTPAMIPSQISPVSQPAVPMPVSHPRTGSCIHSATNTSLVKSVTMVPMLDTAM